MVFVRAAITLPLRPVWDCQCFSSLSRFLLSRAPKRHGDTRLEEIHFCLIIKNYINNCGWSHKSSEPNEDESEPIKSSFRLPDPENRDRQTPRSDTYRLPDRGGLRRARYKAIYKTLLSSSRASYLLETRTSVSAQGAPRRGEQTRARNLNKKEICTP